MSQASVVFRVWGIRNISRNLDLELQGQYRRFQYKVLYYRPSRYHKAVISPCLIITTFLYHHRG